ncbi:ribonuclease H family protein, partial [Staphylococcus epidermidis]
VLPSPLILHNNHHYIPLHDSKKLSPKNTPPLNQNLKQNLYQYPYPIASSLQIHQFNIYPPTQLPILPPINQLHLTPTHLLIHPMTLHIDIPQTSIIKAHPKTVSI